jgi:SAM-dependent methyltransferase
LIARALERDGVTTPFPFLGLFIFRNLRRYSQSTRAKTGQTGPLFYSYVVPINAALILVVIALVLFLVVGSSSAQAAPAPGAAAQSWVEEGWAPWEQELTARQQPEKVMDVIGLRPGMVVGEIGAQTGRFTVHLARRVGPAGRVFANDIDDRALAELRDRVTRYNVPNIEVVRGHVDDPRLPPNALDMAIMVRTYHELAQPRALLAEIVAIEGESYRRRDAQAHQKQQRPPK